MFPSLPLGGLVREEDWGSRFPLSLAGPALLPSSPTLPPPPHLNPVLLVSRQFTGRLLDLFPCMAAGYTSCILCMVQMKPTYPHICLSPLAAQQRTLASYVASS